MRSLFKPQMTIGTIPMDEIEFDVFSRHELVPILMALQYLYTQKQHIVRQILEIIENDLVDGKKLKHGREGLNAWEILVLAACRLGCNLDYDALSDLATNHRKIRQLMELDDFDQKRYPKSTVQENITKLSVNTLMTISKLVVDQGHTFNPSALDKVRVDSFVLKKNIHYPTDINLIYDGVRKVIQLSVELSEDHGIKGWRQNRYLLRKNRKFRRNIERIARSRKKNRDEELKAGYQCYLEDAQNIIDRSLDTIHKFNLVKDQAPFEVQDKSESTVSELHYFIGSIEYISELARRRVIDEEKKIPNDEKAFSIFEPDTELINRGKQPNPIEFGHRVLIVQDDAGFIIHTTVMGRGVTDEKILIPVMKKLQERYNGKIRAASFDKGFWKKTNFDELSKIVKIPVLPKKGKLSKKDSEREKSKEFVSIRKWHSGVESAINALMAGNGLDLCRDKGITGYDRYLALAAIGRNLQTMGTILLEEAREKKREEVLLDLAA